MYLVLDVGATYIKYATLTAEGEISYKGKTKTPMDYDQNTYPEAVGKFVETIGDIYDGFAKDMEIKGITMAVPGQVDIKRGIVYSGGGIRYLHEAHVGELVSARCNNVPVAMENDGKCAALAEVWMGNAKGKSGAVVLVFGTGIGGGIVRHGKVIHGKQLLAGELSFIITDMERSDLDKLPDMDNAMERVNLEEYFETFPYTWTTQCSTINVCQWVGRKKGLKFGEVTGELIYQWISQGDEEVIEIMENTYFKIAKQCLNLYVTLNPEIILIGGGISAQPLFIEGIKKYVDKLKRMSGVYSGIKLDTCKYLNDSNLLGALYNFKQLYGAN